MSGTGIVRRVDELGRVVIPKEIRRVLGIKEGTQIQILMSEGGEMTLKKYSPVEEKQSKMKEVCDILSVKTGLGVAVCDDYKITAAGGALKGIVGKEISESFYRALEERRSGLYDNITITKDGSIVGKKQYVVPIMAAGDLYGGLIITASDNVGEKNIAVCDVAAKMLELEINA